MNQGSITDDDFTGAMVVKKGHGTILKIRLLVKGKITQLVSHRNSDEIPNSESTLENQDKQ